MKFVAAADLRAAERRVLADAPPGTGAAWMREAAGGVAAEVLRMLRGRERAGVLVLAGPGNNGGDGICVAERLASRGIPCEVWVAACKEALSADIAEFADSALRAGVALHYRPEPDHWESAALDFRAGGWGTVVDALLGTGARGEPRGAVAAALAFLRELPGPAFRIALDVPSGWDADTPEPPPWTPRADLTVTVGFPKKGFLSPASRDVVGALRVVPFSLPSESANALPDAAPGVELIAPADIAPLFPRPPRATHKGDRGRLLVFAGSAPMPGAAVLATLGALRGGCGVVHVSASAPAQAAIASRTPQAILAPPLFSPLESFELGNFRAILAGPGLGRTPEAAALVSALLAGGSAAPAATGGSGAEPPSFGSPLPPLVLDADALSLATPSALAAAAQTRPVVLTPHPAELARLLGCTTADIQADRPAAARRAALATGAIVVLKGDATLVASPDPSAPLWLNLTGTPGMARGGSGDVLAGRLASLLATGLAPLDAARAAVYLHGLAGELAASSLSSASMNALDLPDFLPPAFATLSI